MDTLEPATVDTTEMEVVAISSTNTMCVFDQCSSVRVAQAQLPPSWMTLPPGEKSRIMRMRLR